jgi:hypothetical protein
MHQNRKALLRGLFAVFDTLKNSNINIPSSQSIRLNKLPTWFNLVAHKHGEDAVGFDGVVDLDAQEAADGGVHGGFPELGGVHLA